MSIQKCVLENEYFVSCFAVSPSRLSAAAALAVVDSSFSFSRECSLLSYELLSIYKNFLQIIFNGCIVFFQRIKNCWQLFLSFLHTHKTRTLYRFELTTIWYFHWFWTIRYEEINKTRVLGEKKLFFCYFVCRSCMCNFNIKFIYLHYTEFNIEWWKRFLFFYSVFSPTLVAY